MAKYKGLLVKFPFSDDFAALFGILSLGALSSGTDGQIYQLVAGMKVVDATPEWTANNSAPESGRGVMNIGAIPRRCRPFSPTERSVCFIPEAPFFGKCRTGHDLFICQ